MLSSRQLKRAEVHPRKMYCDLLPYHNRNSLRLWLDSPNLKVHFDSLDHLKKKKGQVKCN